MANAMLTAASPGMDCAAPTTHVPDDPLSKPRNVDRGIVANRCGPRDSIALLRFPAGLSSS